MNQYRINVFYSGNGGELGHCSMERNTRSGIVSGQPVGGSGAADWPLGLPEDVGRGTSTGGWHQRDWLMPGSHRTIGVSPIT